MILKYADNEFLLCFKVISLGRGFMFIILGILVICRL